MDMLKFIIGVVIGLGFAIVVGFGIKGLMETQLPQKIDEKTMSSFEEIVRVVRQIESNEINEKNISVNIENPFIIVGFSKGIYNLRDIKNPCVTDSCLCICTREPYDENSCLTYRDSCVKFDSISKLTSDSGSIFKHEAEKGFEITLCSSPDICDFTISGDEKSIVIRGK